MLMFLVLPGAGKVCGGQTTVLRSIASGGRSLANCKSPERTRIILPSRSTILLEFGILSSGADCGYISLKDLMMGRNSLIITLQLRGYKAVVIVDSSVRTSRYHSSI